MPYISIYTTQYYSILTMIHLVTIKCAIGITYNFTTVQGSTFRLVQLAPTGPNWIQFSMTACPNYK